MKLPFTRLEKKQLLIFTLIAFGIPYLMGIPMAFGYHTWDFSGSFCQCPDVLSRCGSDRCLSADQAGIPHPPPIFLWISDTDCTVCC